MKAERADAPSPGRLSDRQAAILVAFGLAFWLVAALFIRIAPFDVFGRDVGTILLFAATLPLAWASVRVAERIAALAPDQLLPGVALASAAAMLCDGVGLIWWGLYGDGDRLPGAAWLLWGVGLILFAAFLDGRRRTVRRG
ncbi:hypothetical protein CKY28_13555 [Sphingomonas lenta]|uniref:Uncharacterized protein n=2 Tax=Sphingomonas lenta TaxID=1141887 RepID=A0A2A2SDH6_9SPHN|nr:hypothetical protein CKY28_13555 [Sphingomonas lenta]